MSDGQETVARNATVLLLAQLMTWGLTLLLTIFLPRYLGATAVGQLHIGQSLWTVMGVLATFGMDTLLTKEIARQPERVGDLLGVTLVLRGLLYLGTVALVALFLLVANYSLQTAAVIAIVGVGNLLWQIIGAFQASLQGLERMEYISLGNVGGKAFNTAISILLLLLGYGVLVIAAVAIGAALLTLLLQAFFLRRMVPIHLSLDRELAGWMLRAGVPYLLSGLFLVAYMQLDVIVISLLVNERVVGWYGAADRLFGTLLFIPTVFVTAVFPALSRMHVETPEQLPAVMSRSFNLLLLLSMPIGLGVMVIADPVVTLLFGQEFIPSGPVLAAFGPVLILTYQNMLLGQFLISVDRQRAWTVVMAAVALLSIPADMVLIPWSQSRFGNGAIGGPLAFLITEAGMLVAGIVLLPQGTLTWNNLWVALRALLAGGLMAVTAWWLRDAFILLPIATAAVVYFFLLWLLRLLPRKELALGVSMLRQLWQRMGLQLVGG